MDNIVVLVTSLFDKLVGVSDGILNDSSVVVRQLKVLRRKFMNHGVDFDYGGVDAVSHQCGRKSTDSKAAGRCIRIWMSHL